MAKKRLKNAHFLIDLQCHRDFVDKILTEEFHSFLNPEGKRYLTQALKEFNIKRTYVLSVMKEELLQ